MRILGIETSCDDTALALLSCTGPVHAPIYTVEAQGIASQAALHAVYGGVFPALAKREHATALTPLFVHAIAPSLSWKKTTPVPVLPTDLFAHDRALETTLVETLFPLGIPELDAIAVTVGPGLEPALWVGITFAQALGIHWNIPVYGINHMEGHVVSTTSTTYPLLALLVSGGHTELVHIPEPLVYTKIGETKDDAVGEAFDKVARMIGLSYPGGPAISRLAATERARHTAEHIFPRPMYHTDDYDFSFSGLKTAVRYYLEKHPDTPPAVIAREFEDAAIDVLVHKTARAAAAYAPTAVTIGGGVSANTYLQEQLAKKIPVPVHYPEQGMATDNAIMIARAGYLRMITGTPPPPLRAQGNWSL